MHKNVPLWIAFFCLLFAISSIVSFSSVNATSNVIHVPKDHAKIQWAIGNATDGDTVLVSTGIYYENILIDKSLILQGENSVIDGINKGHVITICADNVQISGFTIRNSGPGFWDSGIFLNHSNGCSISKNILMHNGHAIWLDNHSNNNIISGNNASNNQVGIGVSVSGSNIVVSNFVFSSKYCGVGFSGASNSVIAENTVSNNENGIWLDHSINITIKGNTASNNKNGLYLDQSVNNKIFHNNIINNTQQAKLVNSSSIWDSGFEGNYWSDYAGLDIDHDGIGDSSYIIDAHNIDNHNLMGLFFDFTITCDEQLHHVTIISNSRISDFNFNNAYNGSARVLEFIVAGPNATPGFCRMRIPLALMNDITAVYLNQASTSYTLLPISDSSHNYLYFAYSHGAVNEVKILCEPSSVLNFSLIVILLVIVILFLTTVVFLKRKKS
ncbi:MAG: right-handed parallel beta-helix repeat-containing protein [Candidatus Bathyarchaeota archaeon]|nr:right-handed parallel beta-helix repeat-containing protein [Candidatus Bathyarchaeota archaeon]